MPTSDPALRLEGVSVSYGHVRAVHEVSFDAHAGRVVALLGPNGAGKSTLLRAICNQATKVGGSVRHYDTDISRTRTHRITQAGVVLVPEGRQVIAPLTVHENLQVAAGAARRFNSRARAQAIAHVYDLFPPLQRLRERPSALLSGGEQQMVAIGRALVARPDVLLLDEPSMGLAPVMVDAIYDFLRAPGEALAQTAVVLAEQNRSALEVADEVVVLSGGRTVHSGLADAMPDHVLADAYLGSTSTSAPVHNELHPSEERA